jgi:hypothetical protein
MLINRSTEITPEVRAQIDAAIGKAGGPGKADVVKIAAELRLDVDVVTQVVGLGVAKDLDATPDGRTPIRWSQGHGGSRLRSPDEIAAALKVRSQKVNLPVAMRQLAADFNRITTPDVGLQNHFGYLKKELTSAEKTAHASLITDLELVLADKKLRAGDKLTALAMLAFAANTLAEDTLPPDGRVSSDEVKRLGQRIADLHAKAEKATASGFELAKSNPKLGKDKNAVTLLTIVEASTQAWKLYEEEKANAGDKFVPLESARGYRNKILQLSEKLQAVGQNLPQSGLSDRPNPTKTQADLAQLLVLKYAGLTVDGGTVKAGYEDDIAQVLNKVLEVAKRLPKSPARTDVIANTEEGIKYFQEKKSSGSTP